MPRPLKVLFLAALFLNRAEAASGQAGDTTRPRAARSSVLAGLVKDEWGDPLSGAEIRVQPGNSSLQTDSTGLFRIELRPADYTVTIRRLGYEPEDFSWRALAGQTTSLSVRLDPVPHPLDTVVVRDRHDRMAGISSVAGVVLDTAFHEIPGVDLQLIGVGRHAVTYEDGTFFFAGLAEGSYVIRARRMGFRPVNFSIRIGSGERHDVAIKMTALPHTLATVEVSERSGFGTSAAAWDDFDRRERWKSSMSVTVDREELGRKKKMPLDWALRGTRAASLIDMSSWFGGSGPGTILPTGGQIKGLDMSLTHVNQPSSSVTESPADACVLLNGVMAQRVPLSSFRADEIERVEVYPRNSDWTGTIAAKMAGIPACRGEGFTHPDYFVIWERGSS